MAVAGEVRWDQLSRGAQDALAWARAAEVESTLVGTRGLLIGMLRSGEDPPNALLRHFGVGEDAVYEALQAQVHYRLEPRAPKRPELHVIPELTGNAGRTIARAAELQRETHAAHLDVACLLPALLETPESSAREAIASVIRAPIDDIVDVTLDWLRNPRLTYPQTLQARFPRPRAKDGEPRARADHDPELPLGEPHLAPLLDEIRKASDEPEVAQAVWELARAVDVAKSDPRETVAIAVDHLHARKLLSAELAEAWGIALETDDGAGIVERVRSELLTPVGPVHDAILDLARATVSVRRRFAVPRPADDRDVIGGLALSEPALDAIGWATALADLRPGKSLDSIVLLCGFVLHARPQPGADTSVAVLNDLQAQMRTKKDGIVAQLLGYDGPLPDKPAGLPGHQQQSDDLRSVVEWAVELAHRIDARAQLRVRHLLAAMLTPAHGRSADVVSRLADEGVDVARLRAALDAAIRDAHPDDVERWAGVLSEPASAAAPASVLAGYDSDDVGDQDQLDIESDVKTLASVLAARDVEPPISVGLFGDWGTGKSFFMNALQRRIQSLEQATQAHAGASAYCRRIKHIHFNAWHYADANLWASLVTQIFDELAAPQDEQTRTMLETLDTTKRARADAEARRARAVAARDELAARVTELERSAQKPARLARTTLEDRSAAPAEAETLLAEVEEKARPDRRLQVREISKLADDLAGIGGAVRTVVRISGRRRALVALLVAVVVFALLQVVTGDALGAVGAAASIVAALTATLAAPLAQARRAAQLAADAAQLIDDEKRRAELELAAQQAERERLTQQLIAAEKDIVAADEEVEAITGGRMLVRFVQERAAAEDYRRYLGLVSLIRRDFVTLSSLMSEAEDPPFDRIVLYIDDLDRCAPTRVVEVLEAVHMLLALKLFVVVVAVDSRWLLRSLEIHYHALRQSEQGPEDEDDYWVATPQNYLEKIFQIPYAVRPMAVEGYGRLVDHIVGETRARPEPVARESPKRAPPEAVGPDRAERDDGGDREPQEQGPTDRPELEEPRPPAPDGDERDEHKPDLTPATLYLTDVELRSIKAVAPLIRTPRAAKRLVNTYRLARASLDAEELPAFVGRGSDPGTHRAALILLAILIGFPSHAAALFQALLDGGDDAGWSEFVADFAGRKADRDQLLKAIVDATGELSPPPGLAAYKLWAGRVGRYSFYTSRLLVPGARAPSVAPP